MMISFKSLHQRLQLNVLLRATLANLLSSGAASSQ
jgi:hypothetical protein